MTYLYWYLLLSLAATGGLLLGGMLCAAGNADEELGEK